MENIFHRLVESARLNEQRWIFLQIGRSIPEQDAGVVKKRVAVFINYHYTRFLQQATG